MRLIGIIALVAMLMPAGVHAQGARFDPRGCNPTTCSESGWIFDDNRDDHATTWRHGLGVVPRAISILFTPDPGQGRVMPVIWSWHDVNAGNPISVEMGRRAVRLLIHRNAPLHGLWDIDSQRWTHFKEGYWKIIVYR
ncbi:MAG: hypothetical protein AAGB15_12730 [Pseudomonadota bacterium]